MKESYRYKQHTIYSLLNVWLTFVFHQVTCNYFQMMNALASPAPIQFQTLAESSRNYEPGSQFSEYVRLQQANAPQTVCPVHQFEPYNATMYVLSFIANGDCLLAFILSLSSSGYRLPRRRFWGSSYFVPPHKRLLNRKQHIIFSIVFFSFEIKWWQAKHDS